MHASLKDAEGRPSADINPKHLNKFSEKASLNQNEKSHAFKTVEDKKTCHGSINCVLLE